MLGGCALLLLRCPAALVAAAHLTAWCVPHTPWNPRPGLALPAGASPSLRASVATPYSFLPRSIKRMTRASSFFSTCGPGLFCLALLNQSASAARAFPITATAQPCGASCRPS